MSYGEADSHPSGFEQGNTGYSGAPMWKIKLQTQQYRAVVEAAQAARLEETKKADDDKKGIENKAGPKSIVDAYVVRGSKGAQLVRHMLVKDLRKAAQVMSMELPSGGIFDDQGGQRAFFALFDGQSTSVAAPLAAEMCCRHVLGKLLRNLLSLPASSCTAVYVKAAMLKTFEDLEKELSVAGVAERCGASLALVVGDWLFTAVLGRCGAAFYQQAAPEAGADPVVAAPTVSGFNVTPLSTQWGLDGPAAMPGQSLGTPEVKSTQFQNGEPFFILTGVPTTRSVTPQEMAKAGADFIWRPRASAAEITSRAAARLGVVAAADCAAVVGFVRKPEVVAVDKGQPAAKRAKKEQQQMESVRLRHILVKFKDPKMPVVAMPGSKPVTRTREEAETVLRGTLTELLKDGEHAGDSAWAAKVTPRTLNATRTTSECKTAIKGGSNCGDLGWLSKKELQQMGRDGFAEAVFGLRVAEWSDVLFSDQGAHLVMRMA